MPYYEIEMKQLISDNADRFEVVFDPGEKELTMPVEFFALCDLREKPYGDEHNPQLDDFLGVILPVIFDEDYGLIPELLSSYKLPSEQEVRLRKKSQD